MPILQRMRAAGLALLAGTLGPGFAPQAMAQATTQTGTVQTVIVAPLSLIKQADMNFGQIAPATTAGNVVMAPATATCTTTGTVIHTGLCQPASFAGMGVRNMMVRITIPTTMNLTGPGTAMVLDTFTLDTAPGLVYSPVGGGVGVGTQRYRITSLTGIYDFRLGGTLHVNANQLGGVYSGTFSVSVQYQ